jgi:ankyrin repeat protein
VGRLDLVRTYVDDEGQLKAPANESQLRAGFAWACEFGQREVAEFLSRAALASEATPERNGEPTGLHWAAHMGHIEIARLLIDRGAPVDAREKRHNGMPIDWALHGWDGTSDTARRAVYCELVAQLVRAGAKLDARWTREGYIASKWQADPQMAAALRGEEPSA